MWQLPLSYHSHGIAGLIATGWHRAVDAVLVKDAPNAFPLWVPVLPKWARRRNTAAVIGTQLLVAGTCRRREALPVCSQLLTARTGLGYTATLICAQLLIAGTCRRRETLPICSQLLAR